MPSVAGGFTNVVLKHAGTWGTAAQATTGGKCVGLQVSHSMNEQTFEPSAVGSGQYMRSAAYILGRLPTVSVSGTFGYATGPDLIIGHFFGTDTSPAEVTASQGDYKHTCKVNTTLLGGGYTSLAYDSSSATVHEFKTVAWRSIGLSAGQVPGEVQFTAEGLADDLTIASATNTNASMASATTAETTPEWATVAYDDVCWLNTQSGGALSSSNAVAVTGFNFQLNRPMKTVGEIKGSTGVGAPVSDGAITGSLELNLKNQPDHTWWTIWNAETAQKAKIMFAGSVIGSGTAKSCAVYMPLGKLVQAPNYAVQDEGDNAVTLTFTLLNPAAAATGMTASTYPYVEIVNTRTTSFVA